MQLDERRMIMRIWPVFNLRRVRLQSVQRPSRGDVCALRKHWSVKWCVCVFYASIDRGDIITLFARPAIGEAASLRNRIKRKRPKLGNARVFDTRSARFRICFEIVIFVGSSFEAGSPNYKQIYAHEPRAGLNRKSSKTLTKLFQVWKRSASSGPEPFRSVAKSINQLLVRDISFLDDFFFRNLQIARDSNKGKPFSAHESRPLPNAAPDESKYANEQKERERNCEKKTLSIKRRSLP